MTHVRKAVEAGGLWILFLCLGRHCFTCGYVALLHLDFQKVTVIELSQGHRGGHTEHLWQESPTMWPWQLACNVFLLLRLYFSASGPWEISSWSFTVPRPGEERISLAAGLSIDLAPCSSRSYFVDPLMDLHLWNLLSKPTWSEINNQLLNCSFFIFIYCKTISTKYWRFIPNITWYCGNSIKSSVQVFGKKKKVTIHSTIALKMQHVLWIYFVLSGKL